ncbi:MULTISPECIES: chorismate mutase [Pseudomonas]|uniref:Chorismate mutase n=1 Tax=Pseudomonas eucalypticola TaxID=2599595 RepID=A0A7D5D4V0_9PSED|nr:MULTISPECIES: chorismate mutase [Pseudomonas]QKZ02635.1 chorismate mutase [Pseudomonas eucalypticola]
MPPFISRTLLLCTAAFTLPAFADAPATLAPLLDSVAQRLEVAPKVALTKWDSHKPVLDAPRERDVIAGAGKLAADYKLDGALAEQFFAAQIEANKLVQYSLLSQWNQQGSAPGTPRADLAKEIRPQLDVLQKQLLERLAAFAPSRTDAQCPRWLAAAIGARKADPLQHQALVRATGELCSAPS